MRNLEEIVRTPATGELRHRQVSSSPVRDATGNIIGVVSVVRNITEHKHVEEALQKAHDELKEKVKERTAELIRANEELAIFREFVEASGQGFSMANLDGHLTYLNPALCRMLGETRPQDRIGQHLSIYFPEESNRRGKEEIKPALMREGHWEGELPMFSRHGTLVPTWHNTFMIRDESGNPIRLAVVITDMTEREQGEGALRESKHRFREILENVHLLSVMLDREGRITFCNDFLLQLTGWQREEVLGTNWFDAFVPADQSVKDLFLESMVCESIPPHHENDIATRTGERRRIAWSNTVLRDSRGRVVGTTSIGKDVTERKQAEEALRKEHRNLKHLLQSSDHERQLIAYEIHDGLAQQLVAAIMEIQAFAYLKDSNPDEAAKACGAGITMLQQAHVEVRRLIAGVRSPILDESGVVEAVAHLVHEESRDQAPKIYFHRRVDFGRLDPTLENAIYRIAQEGLTNACKHSKSQKVRVGLVQRGDRVRIEIRDWGVGFDRQMVPKSRFGLEGIRQRGKVAGRQVQHPKHDRQRHSRHR